MFEHVYLFFLFFLGKTEAIFLINALIRFRGHLELLCSSTSSKVTEIVCRYLSEIPYGKLNRERKLYFGNFGTGKATEEFKVSTEAYGRDKARNGLRFAKQNFKN